MQDAFLEQALAGKVALVVGASGGSALGDASEDALSAPPPRG